ncbi:MAG: hypothetical protein ACLFSJ_02995 [Halorhodospira sp.]
MTETGRGSTALVTAVLLGAALAPGVGLAHGEPGEHVEAFEEHLDDYESDVQALAERLDAIVERYRADDGGTTEQVDEFMAAWKEVKYHAAVEEVATPLYSPIWRAITDLRQAVESGEPAKVVEQRASALRATLYEGLGGLRLRASLDEVEPAGHDEGTAEADGSAEATLKRIREQLDEAVAAYDSGDTEQARSLIEAAYFERFEGVEGGLIEEDPELVTRLEEAFNAELPGLIIEDAPREEVEAKVASMKEALDRSEALLDDAGEASSEAVF